MKNKKGLTESGGDAFPVPADYRTSGMTLREYYAGQALAGLLASSETAGTASDYAHNAVEFADALIAALKVTP